MQLRINIYSMQYCTTVQYYTVQSKSAHLHANPSLVISSHSCAYVSYVGLNEMCIIIYQRHMSSNFDYLFITYTLVSMIN